ncbi:MAG: thiol-disulfide oxidoreductase DCC family protein [Bacteroidetes bacterium]|nr:MAG: thiol-disulfide oxidoreductase DCC family protein [Bacteroidota bacterium]
MCTFVRFPIHQTGLSMAIVIFDGYCNLCNASVSFIMDRDPKRRFKYTANQHQAGQELLQEHGHPPEEVDTVLLIDEDGKLYDRSTAALRIARHLSFPWNLAYGLIIFPRPLRDVVYKWIARNRYRWFGKKDTCRMPTPEERALFL